MSVCGVIICKKNYGLEQLKPPERGPTDVWERDKRPVLFLEMFSYDRYWFVPSKGLNLREGKVG